ncbi:hypothetical protein [Dolosigranulum pigrum]|nr:hypothetical protein [Dolosigranulum pigrum]
MKNNITKKLFFATGIAAVTSGIIFKSDIVIAQKLADEAKAISKC